jgi:cell division septation protein DedD
MPFTDFPNGLSAASDYLSANNSLTAELTGSVADIGRLVVSAEMDFNLKEIICSLLAGRGLKLPNLQICISLNLKSLLGDFIGKIQDTLYQALATLDTALDKFMDHLKLDAVLGRINGLLGEITNIANMINFCSAPIDPIQIPNVLENSMDSFLGKGKSIVDSIGTILPDQIGGCLIDGLSSFDSGIMGQLNGVYDDLITGNLTTDFITNIVADISVVTTSITTLIASETTVPTNYSQGGSDLAEDNATVTDDNGNVTGTARTTNTGIGVLYNSVDEGISGATSNGSAIWAAYQSLGSYQVVDSDGTIYNNIFETFCDPDLIRILRRTSNPTPEISEQIPVRNYCGEIIGYTKLVSQSSPDVSVGTVPSPITDPGFNAGGLSTNPTNEAQSTVAALTATTTAITATATTTSSTATEILFNNRRQTPATGKAWFVTISAVAKRSDALGVTAIKIEGLVDNNDGTVSMPVGAENKIIYNDTTNYNIVLDVTSDQFRVRIQGDTGHTVDWKVKFDFIETP